MNYNEDINGENIEAIISVIYPNNEVGTILIMKKAKLSSNGNGKGRILFANITEEYQEKIKEKIWYNTKGIYTSPSNTHRTIAAKIGELFSDNATVYITDH